MQEVACVEAVVQRGFIHIYDNAKPLEPGWGC